ncbi:putative ankyrin repeat protein [Cotonvirus japonicus]|uniref:Ankyrin repeat protein n=1 Tax=Cotonvirus japonicus TaxID=2811091 RepID=A0ABM7NTD4_9VIRU|nr:putative ankyrin repeat protein [Cotonvirus japonicus]BCS83389.1 putative ankyrin repeat protein [Cotonvirus japonicus]
MYFIEYDDPPIFFLKLLNQENILSDVDRMYCKNKLYIQEIIVNNNDFINGNFYNFREVENFLGQKYYLDDINTIKLFVTLANSLSINKFLLWCISNSKLEYIEYILEFNNNVIEDNDKIITHAVYCNNYEITKYLIEIGCQYDNVFKFKYIPKKIDKNIVKLLVENKNYDIQFIKQMVRNIISLNLNFKLILSLIKFGFDINSMNYESLLYCVNKIIDLKTMTKIFKYVNIRKLILNKCVCTRIISSICVYGCLEMIKFVTSIIPVPETEDHSYIFYNITHRKDDEHIEVFDYLINIGYQYKSSLNNIVYYTIIYDNTKLFKKAINLGFDFDKFGEQTLMDAIKLNNIEIVTYFIENGIFFNTKKVFRTIIEYLNCGVIELLIAYGININDHDNYMIKYAVKMGNFTIAKYLKNLGFEYNEKDDIMNKIVIDFSLGQNNNQEKNPREIIDEWIDVGVNRY